MNSRWPWTGRTDFADGPHALRWHQIVRRRGSDAAPVALLGFACDAGVVRNQGRGGAAQGPAAIRGVLSNVAAHGTGPVDDLGDVTCDGDALESAQEAYAAAAAATLARWLDDSGSRDPVGVINFDAHFDLRGDPCANSDTPFRQILDDARARGRPVGYYCLGVSRASNTQVLFERAAALGASWVEDLELRADRYDGIERDLKAFIARFPRLYLTLCLDVLPASVAPGVSAPAALGVDAAIVERLVAAVVASGRVAIADVAELNPRFDVDGRTARIAARFVARFATAARG